MSENVTLISFYCVFLIWRRDRGYLKSASDFSFLLCLSNVACKQYPKSANRYLTFGNLITTSDTPKVQSSEAIAVEEYLIKVYVAIIIVFFSFKQDTSPEY